MFREKGFGGVLTMAHITVTKSWVAETLAVLGGPGYLETHMYSSFWLVDFYSPIRKSFLQISAGSKGLTVEALAVPKEPNIA